MYHRNPGNDENRLEYSSLKDEWVILDKVRYGKC